MVTVWIGAPPCPPGPRTAVQEVVQEEQEPKKEPKFPGFSDARVELMKAIAKKGEIKASEYVKTSGKGIGTVNLLLRTLENKGVLSRTLDQNHTPGNGAAPYVYFFSKGYEELIAKLLED